MCVYTIYTIESIHVLGKLAAPSPEYRQSAPAPIIYIYLYIIYIDIDMCVYVYTYTIYIIEFLSFTFERCSVFVGGVRLGVWGVVLVVCVCVGVGGVVLCRCVCVTC